MNVKHPIVIGNKDVEFVSSYKYLGCIIQDDLKWNVHVDTQTKKAEKRMYVVRSLKKVHVDCKLIAMFYNSIVSSVLNYVISSWYNACTAKEKRDVNKCKRKVCKMVSPECTSMIDDPESVCNSKIVAMTKKILKIDSHPLHQYFQLLPHGSRLNVRYCRTNRYKQTFVPSAIKLYNNTTSAV